MLPALDRLLFAGVVPARDRDALADAYLFLRRAEHRVQMVDGRPDSTGCRRRAERNGLARSMGYPDRRAAFEAALAGHRERVLGALRRAPRQRPRRRRRSTPS